MSKHTNPTKLPAIHLYHRIKKTAILLFRSRLAIEKPLEITDFEFFELFDITQTVLKSRLKTGVFTIWKHDEKHNYQALYESIKQEIIEANKIYFQPQSGRIQSYMFNKYNTLILDFLFEFLQLFPPQRSPNIAARVFRIIARDIEKMPDIHLDDSKVAGQLLIKYTQERTKIKRRKKPLTKKQRLMAISMAVRNISNQAA